MRKPRPDSKLKNLPEEKQAALVDMLRSGLALHVVKARVREEFGVDVSINTLSKYWMTECVPAILAHRKRAVSTAEEIANEAKRMPGQFDDATIDALKQKAFELSVNPASQPGDVKALFMLVLKARDQELKERDIELATRRIQIMEAEFRAMQQKLASEAGTVDPKKVADEMDRILGRAK